MTSQSAPTKPADGVPSIERALRNHLQAAGGSTWYGFPGGKDFS